MLTNIEQIAAIACPMQKRPGQAGGKQRVARAGSDSVPEGVSRLSWSGNIAVAALSCGRA
jgi:hypothetical protein